MTGRVFVGTSGFGYDSWRGGFYPDDLPSSKLLSHYATRLNAVEINYTFRRRITDAAVDRWRASVGEGFSFAVKASFAITHLHRFAGAGDEVETFITKLSRLGTALGPVMFQSPTNLPFDAALFDAFFGALPPGRYAIEPLHPSFDEPRFDDLLARHGVARCVNDDHADPSTARVTSSFAYLRLRQPRYSREAQARQADTVRTITASGADAYVFFRHTDDPSAPRRAVAFRRLIARA